MKSPPPVTRAIREESLKINFDQSVEETTGMFLRAWAASKPSGHFLELGTGTGISTAWILDGMDSRSRLLSIYREKEFTEVAKKHLAHDSRVRFEVGEAKKLLNKAERGSFDFIFADAWDGKFSMLENAITLLKPGGIYIVDDIVKRDSWPRDHEEKVLRLVEALERLGRFLNLAERGS